MIKSGENIQSFYNSNILQIKVNKRANNTNNNTKNNSPKNVSSHQENNYFYNTKINRLILQEAPNNNQIQNIYQQQEPDNKRSILIEYDLLANNINSIIPPKKQMQTLYKKNKNNILNVPITVNIQKKENEINNLYEKDINGFSCIKINRNPKTNNIFNNYKKNLNNRKYHEYDERIINSNYIKNNSNNSYQIMNIKIMQNSESINDSKTKNYFYHKENNNNDFKYSKNNILQKNIIINNDINNKTTNCKKIPIKKENIGNYYIRNPGMPSLERNNGTNRKNNHVKSRYKSPEIIIGDNKLKKDNFSTIQNDKEVPLLNNESGYTSKFGFYRKNEEFNKNKNISINNDKDNMILKNKTSDNINKSRSVFKNNNFNNNLDNNDIESMKKLNPSNDIYSKIKPKNCYKFRGANEKSKSKEKEKEKEKGKNDNLSLSENKMNNINNFKTYIKNKLKDYNSMKPKLEEFCENLEQIYFISFKKSYNFFIQNLKLFYQQKGSNRAIILKRFKKEKSNRYNNKKTNNSMINININNRTTNKNDERTKSIDIGNEYKNKKGTIEIEDYNEAKSKSPTKFIELQNNIAKSMMKINQDSYIKMFNNIFNRHNENNERYRSPLINKGNINIDNDSVKYSFEENNKEKVNRKYNTNTNVHPHYHKRIFNKRFNKLNINIPHNNDSELRNCLRTSLNTENTSKVDIGYKSNIIKMKKLSEYNNNEYSLSNNINSININNIEKNINDINNEYNQNLININEKYDKTYYYRQKMQEQNQKYNINNTIDPNKYSQRLESGERKYKKIKRIINQKNNLLYSKPLLKKSITKVIDQEQNNNNIIELELKRNDNSQTFNNTFNKNMNPPKNSRVYDIKTFKEEIKEIKNIEEIIVKNVGTEDKRLHVFIKYIILENFGRNKKDRLLSKLLNMENKIKYKYFDQNKFIENHTDSISIIKSNNKNIYIKNSKKLNDNKNNKYKELTSRGKEESKNEKENIDNSEEELNNNCDINDEVKNSINYLISLLQNVYDDNKKSILYNFFKNLKKIKTNSLLYKVKNLKSDLNINNVKDMKRNLKIRDKIFQNNINSRNMENMREASEDKDKNGYNTQEMHMDKNNMNININNEDKINNKKESLMGSIRELKEEAIKIRKKKSERNIVDKDKDNSIKEIDEIKENQKLNESKTIEEEKDDIRKKKLAKLGKLFNNLNQENNIINAIKEQFLDWTSKNDFPKNRKFGNRNIDDNQTTNKVKNKEYGVKTFNKRFKFNKDVYIENETEINENFKRKLKIFRNKLIYYSIKNPNKEKGINFEKNNKNNRYKGDEDY